MAQEYAMYGWSIYTGLQGYLNFGSPQPFDGGINITGEWFPNVIDAEAYVNQIKLNKLDPQIYALQTADQWYDEYSIIAGGSFGTFFDGFVGPLYKQFYGPLAWTFGGTVHLFTDRSSSGYGIGLMPRTGVMYYLSPTAYFEASTGLRLGYPLSASLMLQLGANIQW